ncbi:hypothetical protein VTO73DRAFT_11970 [Trametes versicolor]
MPFTLTPGFWAFHRHPGSNGTGSCRSSPRTMHVSPSLHPFMPALSVASPPFATVAQSLAPLAASPQSSFANYTDQTNSTTSNAPLIDGKPFAGRFIQIWAVDTNYNDTIAFSPAFRNSSTDDTETYTIENRIYEHYYAQRSLETNYGKNALNVFAVVPNASKWTNHDVCDDPFPLLNPMGTIPGPLNVALYQPLAGLNASESGDSLGDGGPVFGTLGVNSALAAAALLPLSVNLTAQGKSDLWRQYSRSANGARVISPPAPSEAESGCRD